VRKIIWTKSPWPIYKKLWTSIVEASTTCTLYPNVNSDNLDLIRAVLCAGFHPNIAVVAKEGAQNITFDLYGKRRCHNSLKLRQPKIRLRGYAFQHPTLVYFKKMFTTSDDETHFFLGLTRLKIQSSFKIWTWLDSRFNFILKIWVDSCDSDNLSLFNSLFSSIHPEIH